MYVSMKLNFITNISQKILCMYVLLIQSQSINNIVRKDDKYF